MNVLHKKCFLKFYRALHKTTKHNPQHKAKHIQYSLAFETLEENTQY